MTASARGYRKKGVEIRCWQGNVSHIDIMKQVCQGMSRLDLAGGLDFQRAMCCGIGIEPASESSKPKLASKVDIVQLNSRLISLDWDAVSTSLGCCRKESRGLDAREKQNSNRPENRSFTSFAANRWPENA